jgi:chemotaxis protein CheX
LTIAAGPLEPFVTAVCATLREMAGIDATLRATGRATRGERLRGITAAVRLVSPAGDGLLALDFPPATAAAVAGRVLAGAGVPADEAAVHDCLGEVANVTAGLAKTLSAGTPHHFALTPPELAAGGEQLLARDWLVAAFDTDAGEFRLHVRLPGGPAAAAPDDGGTP